MKPINNELVGDALIAEMKTVAHRIASDMQSAFNNRDILLKAKREELDRERETIAAMEKTDSSENVPLHIARENISRLTIEITALEASCSAYARLAASSADNTHPGGVCAVGSVVAIRDEVANVTWVIKLYPEGLGNAKIGAISIDTPLGQALLQHRPLETVICNAPSGEIPYYIKEVL